MSTMPAPADGDWEDCFPPGYGGCQDIYVAKFSPDLSQLLYSSYFGGPGNDRARASIAIDANDNVYLSGMTESPSSSFPWPNVQDSVLDGGAEAFLLKLNSQGAVQWWRYFGGNDFDEAYSNVRINAAGTSLYIAGVTCSEDLNSGSHVGFGGWDTMEGVPLNCSNNGDGFVARFSTAGILEKWTYFGGAGDDNVSGNDGLELEPTTGNVVIAGNTWSTTLYTSPSPPLYSGHQGGTGSDCYVAVLTPDLELEYVTYFGGTGPDEPGGLAVDDVGNIYFSGNTCSSDFPKTGNAFDKTYGGDGQGDAFIVKFYHDVATSTLSYSTYLGGGLINPNGAFEGDRGRSLVLKSNGYVVVSGDSDALDFPTTSAALKPNFIGGKSDGIGTIHNPN
jgi:hypothetical protein